jgi:hypothetical protein
MLAEGRELLLASAPQVARLTSAGLEAEAHVSGRINRGNGWRCNPEYFLASRP